MTELKVMKLKAVGKTDSSLCAPPVRSDIARDLPW